MRNPSPILGDPPKVAKVTVVATTAQDETGTDTDRLLVTPPDYKIHLVALEFEETITSSVNPFLLRLNFGFVSNTITISPISRCITMGGSRITFFTGDQTGPSYINTDDDIVAEITFSSGAVRLDAASYKLVTLPTLESTQFTNTIEEISNSL